MSIIRYQFIQKIEWWNSLNIGTCYVHVLISHTTQWKFPISIFILLLLLYDLATILLVLLIQVPCVQNN